MINLAATAALVTLCLAGEPGKPFAIEVVDAQTGRGVPLIELETVDRVRYVTDSNGLVAFDEPELMGQRVFFYVRGHGYEFPPDGFGFRGRALHVEPGGHARLEVARLNVAERLYRVTGGGIYRDTVRLGRRAPIARPLLNAQVWGSDSVVCAPYRGRIYWFWGDTNRPAYPLGNFHVPGATSRLPEDGGLAPEVGVDLEYFVGDDGFARPTAQLPGEGPTWISGLLVLDTPRGPRMFAHYVKVRKFLEIYEWGLVEFDDESGTFRHVATFPLEGPIQPHGAHPLITADESGTPHIYFAHPYPYQRVRADAAALADVSQYESFTCLVEGSSVDKPRLDRDAAGHLRWGWKRATSAVDLDTQRKWIGQQLVRPDELLAPLRDIESGREVVAHRGSVYWNDFRRRYVMIFHESGGTASHLGEVWFAEADAPTGPWVYARKIVTHDKTTFYNPKQHPFFDQEGGRIIYFEGTYTQSFSTSPQATPRYDYNQVMYRLDLADARLNLPLAIRAWGGHAAVAAKSRGATSRGETSRGASVRGGASSGKTPHHESSELRAGAAQMVEFFALERPRADGKSVAIVVRRDDAGHESLALGEVHDSRDAGLAARNEIPARPSSEHAADQSGSHVAVAFYALPVDGQPRPPGTVPLFEFTRPGDAVPIYSTRAEIAGYTRAPEPLCLVWDSPIRVALPGPMTLSPAEDRD